MVLRRPGVDSARRYRAGRRAMVVSGVVQPRQVDGEVVEPGTRLEARVRPGALTVRVARR
jgi:diacylglycerol kinase family enzyme